MAKYAAYVGPEWVVDVVAESQEEAMEKALQINPAIDTIELITVLADSQKEKT